jgi:hypothetical protein
MFGLGMGLGVFPLPKDILNFHGILRWFITSLAIGLAIATLGLPAYFIGVKLERKRKSASFYDYEKSDEKLKKLIFSNFFFMIIFCLVATFRIVIAISFDESISTFDVIMGYFCALVLGFCFPRFVLFGKRLWEKAVTARKSLENGRRFSSRAGVIFYVYCVVILGFAFIGLGLGTFGFVFTRCVLSSSTPRLAIKMYTNTLVLGFCFEHLYYFLVLYNRHKNKTG